VQVGSRIGVFTYGDFNVTVGPLGIVRVRLDSLNKMTTEKHA